MEEELLARLSREIQNNLDRQLARSFQTIHDDLKSYFIKHNAIQSTLSEEIRTLRELIESSKFVEKERIALFVDSQNLYYSARMGYAAKVDYEKLLRLITGTRNLTKAYAYIVQPPEGDVKPFATSLERIGYIVKTKDVR
ncbi:MAG: NYN domain-containing protein, partial [candidate division WOR-3 bacterium]